VTWRVEGTDGRWAALGENGLDCDDRTFVDLAGQVGRPVPVTPTGPSYTPLSDSDPVWQYLMALHVIPGPWTITGTPPPVPVAPSLPEGDERVF
jgi:hypothetical protein